jgi:hypothetical protein
MSGIADKPEGSKRRPPQATQFQPGKSGNPGGRPKGSRNVRTELEQMMRKQIPIREGGKSKSMTRQQAMLRTLSDKALRGDIRAILSITNILLKREPNSSEQAVREEALSEVDAEIISDFLRRNQPPTS